MTCPHAPPRKSTGDCRRWEGGANKGFRLHLDNAMFCVSVRCMCVLISSKNIFRCPEKQKQGKSVGPSLGHMQDPEQSLVSLGILLVDCIPTPPCSLGHDFPLTSAPPRQLVVTNRGKWPLGYKGWGTPPGTAEERAWVPTSQNLPQGTPTPRHLHCRSARGHRQP